jgi:large subunit ribosomal protein LP0
MPSREKKEIYFATLTEYLGNYNQLFIVEADHVGSKLMADIRYKMRGIGDVLMGKNTMMRKCINLYIEANPTSGWGKVLPLLKGNVGFIFVKDDLGAARKIIVENTVPAPARAGTVANVDVYVPPGPTGCDPSQTSYFQALNVPTKISRGQIEITNQVHAVEKGTRVTPGAADLLNKLGITPFTFGLLPTYVYDNGSVYDPAVLDLTMDIVAAKFGMGARNVAAMSLACNYPTLASVPHSLAEGVKFCVAMIAGCESKYTFEKGEQALLFLSDPEAAKAAMAAAAAAAGGGGGEEEKKEEEEEEEEEEVAAGGMFGDEGDDDGGW